MHAATIGSRIEAQHALAASVNDACHRREYVSTSRCRVIIHVHYIAAISNQSQYLETSRYCNVFTISNQSPYSTPHFRNDRRRPARYRESGNIRSGGTSSPRLLNLGSSVPPYLSPILGIRSQVWLYTSKSKIPYCNGSNEIIHMGTMGTMV